MRLIIISNRLPFTASMERKELMFRDSVGGLATGLQAYLQKAELREEFTEYLWLGWPGISPANEGERVQIKKRALQEYNAIPVFVPRETMEKCYLGICNKTLWPLFHYIPSHAAFDEDLWRPYEEVNRAFCTAVVAVARPDDIVWIHDYHLMLLPQMLRERMPALSVGFFLHIPFPSFEIFRLLPDNWRKSILRGLLGADLIGFHTYDYTQYFLRCINRLLGRDHDMGRIFLEDRIAKADTFPMGIEFNKFNDADEIAEVHEKSDELSQQLAGFTVILSIDRLDYTKGITQRLEGYRTFLKRNPSLHGKVVLLCVVVPSRTGVEQYHLMKRKVDELIGDINGSFGNVNWMPIIYQYRQLSFNSMAAIYRVSDIALVTPVRDGMNLIAKEYLASRVDGTGVLILSEMAGVSHELGESLIINPHSIEEIASGIERALTIPKSEQIRRNTVMRMRLRDYDVVRWAEDFLSTMGEVKQAHLRYEARLLYGQALQDLRDSYELAENRLLLLDYDNTLVPFAELPELARPTTELLEILARRSSNSTTDIVLISGRSRQQMQEWFSGLDIGLVAEHGVWIKPRDKEWSLIKPLLNDWKIGVKPILRSFVDQLPGSFVEEKEYSLAWHYRRCDQELAAIRSQELIDDLLGMTANMDTQILHGNKAVEIRNGGVNKGIAGLHWLAQRPYDFVLAIGDDWTDEDLFKALPQSAFTIKVGMSHSHARFNLRNHLDVRQLLNQLLEQQVQELQSLGG